MGYGMRGHAKICFQQSFGTAYTASYYSIPLISESLIEAIPPIVPEGMRSRYEAGEPFEGPHEITGDLVFEAHPILAGVALKAWMGQASGTAVASHYSWTFKPCTSEFDVHAAVPPMTIEVYRDVTSAHQYYDMLCDQLSFEIAHGAIQKITMSMIGGKFAQIAKGTPSYLSGSEFTWDQTSVALAGTAEDAISNMTLTMMNALEAKGTLNGTKTPARVKRSGFRSVELSGNILFENETEFDLYRNKTNQAVVIDVQGGAISSGYNAEIKFDIPRVKYREFPANIGGPGMIEVGFTADCLYHSTSATAIEITLVNSQTAY